jgi:hypothetical protein
MAVIVVIALFAIMLLFMGMSLHSLNYLRHDLKLIERQQLQRIHQMSAIANTAIATNALIRPELFPANSSSLPKQP